MLLARARKMATAAATPPALTAVASAGEQARSAGLARDTAAGKALDWVTAPTLVMSARDDLWCKGPGAEYVASQITNARLLGLGTKGLSWVGHSEEVIAAILCLLVQPTD